MRASFSLLALALALSQAIEAHSHHALSAREVAAHQAISERCASKAGAFTMARKKRSLAKRASLLPRDTSVEITTESPHYSTIQNDTCVLVPEVTAGPYVWHWSQTLRQDMREGQAGVPLYLDIGVMDVNTCEPAPNVLLDLWHCNATGSYSSFDALDPNTPFEELMKEMNITYVDGMDLHTDSTTWLRGMWPTDSNGVMEMVTIYPGFYVERTIHIHVQAHTNWTVRSNGTIAASNYVETGQLLFDDELTEKIMAVEPYASHTQINRTTNLEDGFVEGLSYTGWNPFVQIEALDGEDVTKGMIGYITLGVNMTATGVNGSNADPMGGIPSSARTSLPTSTGA